MFDKKYAVIIADGSEEIEITVPTDILRRSGATCELISVNCLTVIGSHGIKITADKLIAEVDYSAYDGVIVPGGMDGAKAIAACKQATDFIYGVYNRQNSLQLFALRRRLFCRRFRKYVTELLPATPIKI